VVTGKENIPVIGPLIIVANHPNTLIDPLIIGSITKQKIGFIANAGLFKNKLLSRIFRYAHVIPIYRKEDMLPGVKPDNKNTFVKCHEYLGKGKNLLTFPEGTSLYELKLREIKTGTARIALSFEDLNNFEGNLKILPIALDYSDSIQFRSMVSVTVNRPITVNRYKQAYLNNEYEAILELTEDIKKALAKNIPDTSGKDQEGFLIKVHKFYSTYHEPMANLYLDPKRSLILRKQISKALKYMIKHNPGLYRELQIKMVSFFDILKSEGLTPGFFTDKFLEKNKSIVFLGYFSKFILLLPIYVFGLLINYLPYILPSKIFYALKIDIEYKTSVEMITGIITFPFFYFLEIWFFRKYISTEFLHSLLLFLTFLITGYVAMYYWTEIKRFSRVLHFYFFMKPSRKLKLLELRKEILILMDEARKSLV
jgi:1-acyl-sn-glycerol-3-phosphate acyltransferase